MPALRRHLTPDTIRRFIAERCLGPSDRGLVGIEIELLTYPSSDPRLRARAADLAAIAERTTLPAGSSITLEPGGQLELSGAGAGVIDADAESRRVAFDLTTYRWDESTVRHTVPEKCRA